MKLSFRAFRFLLVTATAMGFSNAYADIATPPSNEYSLGIEGFHDVYREPGPDVTVTTDYGSVTGSWMHYWPIFEEEQFMLGIDGRYSYGTDSYKSPSGTLSGAAQDETDDRILTGIKYNDFAHGNLTPYLGVGVRYFVDNGKGKFTNLGAFDYDRRITQAYVPIGLTYNYVSEHGWTLTPNFEFDPLIVGNVNSRLTNGGGFYTLNGITYPAYNIDNTQKHNGYGLRSSLMLGWTQGKVNFQVGPFIRYWKFDNSDVTVDPNGNGWIEPKNSRVQVGGALKVTW